MANDRGRSRFLGATAPDRADHVGIKKRWLVALADVEAIPANDVAERPNRIATQRFAGPAWCLVLIVVALLIGMWNVSESGPKWPDGPRYANGGAMIHDWILSGELLHPYEFAKKNYTQYPGFSIPYHPPGYPGLLALWFLAVGMSYASARCFVALCLGLGACCFCGILKRLGANRYVAMAGSLLLLTTPEIVLWARGTMSEIPALMFILAGSYCFIAWVNTKRPSWCWAAFALAELAFLSRVTTAGILPAWFLYLVYKKEYRRILSPHLIVPAVVYLVANYAWVKFALTFVSYEVGGATWNRVAVLSWENISFLPGSLPALAGWAVLATAVVSLALMWRGTKARRIGTFWLFWLLSCYVFHLSMPNNLEPRYFVAVLPAVIGLAISALVLDVRWRYWRGVCVLAIVAMVAGNLFQCTRLPHGFVGNDSVAMRTSQLDEPGNILLSCWMDQDLIFRLRCCSQRHERRLIRSDRSLAIRLAPYAGVKPRNLAKTPDDVLEIVRRGRIRYLLTCSSPDPNADSRPADMVLAHNTAISMPEHFELLGRMSVTNDIGLPRKARTFLWRFRGTLLPGPCEIPVVIPTANLAFTSDAGMGSAPTK